MTETEKLTLENVTEKEFKALANYAKARKFRILRDNEDDFGPATECWAYNIRFGYNAGKKLVRLFVEDGRTGVPVIAERFQDYEFKGYYKRVLDDLKQFLQDFREGKDYVVK